MTPSPRTIAVLGSGTMGSQLAAHVANGRMSAYLFGMSMDARDPEGAPAALSALGRIKPPPLASSCLRPFITAADYSQLHHLESCDLVIEAISENPSSKKKLYQTIESHLRPDALLVSNTSGLSIDALAQSLPAARRPLFCGMHFFNPPRYMPLVELIPHKSTAKTVLHALEGFATTGLGKHVVIARDTPGFIANRLGVFALMVSLHYARTFGLSLDTIDALTGPLIGRAKSATLRTIDLVGLDVLAQVCRHLHDTLHDDPWHDLFRLPSWMNGLMEQGSLGQKTQRGIYHKHDGTIDIFDIEKNAYVPRRGGVESSVKALFALPLAERFSALEQASHPQARFLYQITLELYHYAAYHLTALADDVAAIDRALRWGYGWQHGPFETWQASGWQNVAQAITQAVSNKTTLCDKPLPAWATDSTRRQVYDQQGAFSPRQKKTVPTRKHPVYDKQLFAPSLLGEQTYPHDVIYEDNAIKLWHDNDRCAVLSLTTPHHTLSYDAIVGIKHALTLCAEQDRQGLVIWQQEPPFCLGANLLEILLAGRVGKLERATLLSKAKEQLVHLARPDLPSLETMPPLSDVIDTVQETFEAIRCAPFPVVAAVQGLALGGGCEMLLHCDGVVAAQDSFIGLVEAGVGLLPAGGGCAQMAARAAQDNTPQRLMQIYRHIALGQISTSAVDAQAMGYLRTQDAIVMNPHELLYVAKQHVHALSSGGYRAPLGNQFIAAAGSGAAATCKAALVNMHEGAYISDHDRHVARLIADVLCGNPLPSETPTPASWYRSQEKKAFIELLKSKKTQKRIDHMLRHNKPLRN